MTRLLWLLLIALILGRYYCTRPRYSIGDFVQISAPIRSEPVRYSHSQMLSLQGFRIFLEPYPELHYGDRVVITGQVGEQNQLLNPNLLSHTESQRSLFSLRTSLLQVFQRSLPVPHSALIAGVVLGSKASISQSFYQALRQTGTLHVVVASGMNVTLIAGFLVQSLIHFVSRRRAVVISFAGIWIYTLLAGLEAPLIRAAIMGSIALTAQAKGKLYRAWRALFLAALLMLIVNPNWFADLGFLLSFTATASLMLFESKIRNKINFAPQLFRESLSTSLAAQIGVAPIIYLTFGQFNPLSPIINALILWTIPPITVIGALAGIIGLLIPFIARLILLLIFPLTWWFITIINIFS